VVAQLVAGPQRVGHGDVQVGREEREVVVAAVPDDDVGLGLGAIQDGAVVDAGVHHHALADGLLVLLALLDGRVAGVDVGHGREPLHAHPLQVAVGHRVADQRHAQARIQQQPADPAAGLALPGAGTDRADGHHRLGGAQHRGAGADQPEVRAGGQRDRRLVHDVLVGEVAVGQHDLVDLVVADDRRQLLLRQDRDAVGVVAAGQRGWVGAAGDPGDLGGGEGDHPGLRVVAEDGVEVVEVAPAGAHDHHGPHGCLSPSDGGPRRPGGSARTGRLSAWPTP